MVLKDKALSTTTRLEPRLCPFPAVQLAEVSFRSEVSREGEAIHREDI